MTVRIAAMPDAAEICRLLLMSHRENGIFAWSLRKVQYTLHCLLTGSTEIAGVIGVIGVPKHLEAMAMIVITEYWYTEDKHLEELIVFVDPEHRRSDHAKELISWLDERVQLCRIPLISGVMSNTRTEAKCRLYARHMKKIGEFFVVEPRDVHVDALAAE